MKTPMQELIEKLEAKILPCDDENSYIHGMNVAHNNLIYNLKNYWIELEKEYIINALLHDKPFNPTTYLNQKYKQIT